MFANHLLSCLIVLPILGAMLCLLLHSEEKPIYTKLTGLTTSIFNLILCLSLFSKFNPNNYNFQLKEDFIWIKSYNIHYALGIDGLSFALLILTCLTTLIVILASCNSIKKNLGQYMAAFLVTQAMMIGVFSSLDAILFYVFWEGMLIPMYLSIGIWGSGNRSYASIKFFLYTYFGSVLMLIALLYLGLHSGSFFINDFYKLPLSLPVQLWIFGAFALAFMVKVPMWPLHTWLPDAHTSAPAGGSVVLAALMLKLGTYGFLRFSLPIVPDACRHFATPMIILSLISIVYISILAIQQKDMKRLVAYSSIAHMGFVILACFSIYSILQNTQNLQYVYLALQGGMFQMLAHAISSGALFVGIGILYDQTHTHLMHHFGGVAKKMPIFAAFFMLFCLSNIGLPGTAGFVGEFMILLSLFKANFWVLTIAASAVVFSVAYTLWMYRQVFLDEINPDISNLHDIRWPEITNLILLSSLIIFLGIYPHALLQLLDSSVQHIATLSLMSKLA